MRRSISLQLLVALALLGLSSCVFFPGEEAAPEGGSGGAGAAGGGGGASGGAGGVTLCADGPGDVPGSLRFDGSTWVETTPAGDAFDTVPLWVSAWIYPEPVGGSDGSFPVFGTSRSGSEQGWQLSLEGLRPVLTFGVTPSGVCADSCGRLEAIPPLPAQTWSHVGIAFKVYQQQGSGPVPHALIYVNGLPAADTVLGPSGTEPLPQGQSFWIGGSGCANGGCFVGLVDEVRAFEGDLIDSSYRRDLLERLGGGRPDLLALYRLDRDGASVCNAATGTVDHPVAGRDGRILRHDRVPSEGSWADETPFAPAETRPAPGCASGSGYPLSDEIWACKASLAARPFDTPPLGDTKVGEICGVDHHVCSEPGDLPRLGVIPYAAAELPPGCFAFAAAPGCAPCDLAVPGASAVGRACGYRSPGASEGCFDGGSINTGFPVADGAADGCLWREAYNGVLCCSDL